MGTANGDGEGVDAGRFDVGDCLGWIGSFAWRVRARGCVRLAADITEFCFKPETVGMCPLHRFASPGDIGMIRQVAGIEHRRTEPGFGSLPQEFEVIDVIEMNGDVYVA